MEKFNLKLVQPEDSSHPKNLSSNDAVCLYGKCDGRGFLYSEKDGNTISRLCQCIKDKSKLKYLGERFFKVRLATMEPRNPKQKKLRELLLLQPNDGVFLYGKGGTGKTHFLAAMYNYMDDKHKRIKYLEDATLKDELRNAELNNDYGFVYDMVNDFDCIFLDDLGKQAMSPFYQSALYRLFNEAYKQKRYLFITANDSLATLGSDEYWGSHVARRVEDLCQVVEF